ncbi:MAG: hypothetical protein RIQ40_119 [Planctomycetota bacterium]
MHPGTRATPLIVRMVVLLLVVSGNARAGTLTQFQVPRPVTSAEFEKVVKDAQIPQGEHAAVEAAFDAYVDEWQRLRDRTLRPLGGELAQLEWKLQADMNAPRERQDVNNPTPEQLAEEAAEFQRIFDAARSARAALLVRARQAYERVGQLDARIVAALRAGPRSEQQTHVIDALTQERAQRLAAAMIRSTNSLASGRLLSRLPAAPKDLDPSVAEAFRERAARLDRDSLRLLQRIAESSLAEGDENQATAESISKLVDLRLKALDDLGALLTGDGRFMWVESARDRMLHAAYLGLRAPPTAVVAAIGDRMDPPARKRLDRWISERRAIEDELLRSDDWSLHAERIEALKQLDAQALSELADSTRTPALVDDGFAREAAMRAMREAGTSLEDLGQDDETFGGMQRRMSARMEVMNDATEGAAADAGGATANPVMAMMQQRGLQQSQVNRIRDALGITAEQRATWDALAGDVLEASQKLHDAKAIKPSDMSAGPKEGMDALLRMGEYRTEQQELEEHWFESIAAAFPGLSREALADQRSRRTLQRLRDLGGVARMMSMMTGDRSSGADLDAVIDRLPSDIRARIAPQAMAARERRTRDLQASIDASESFIRTMSTLTAGMQAGQEEPDPEAMQRLMKAQAEFAAAAQERARLAKSADREELEAMAATLTPQAAATLRRAVRAQQYPEVYRAMDRVDGTIDRVMSLPDLTPAQLTTLSTEADAFRARSDDIADRAVAVLTEAEASQAAMITNAGNPENPNPMMETIEKVRRNELANADLDYDRSELSARALRRMRAVLSPSQAQAAGLAER